MISEQTFESLVDYLVETVGASVMPGYGEGDNTPKKDKEAELCDLFENHIYVGGSGYFLLSDSGVLHVFNGKYYEKVTTETFLQEVIKNALARMRVGKVYQKFSNKVIAKECFSGMENKNQGRFLPDRRYIVFNNGIFDVKEGRLRDFDMNLRTDLILDIDYDPTATDALWDTKITEIIPNKDMREAFKMFCGILLINRSEIKVEYVCFLLGPGSNGKSVIASSIAAVFGDEYFAKFDPEQLLSTNDRMFNLASLDGMIANFTDDLNKGDISSKGFKSFASGEKFQARHPFGRKIFKVKAPLMLCCANEMPPTTDDSWGYHRRILPIYSSQRTWSEKDKDPQLEAKLSSPSARTAIFNWIYEGYKKIIANGGNINLGQDVLNAQIELREDSNSVRRWIRDTGLVKIAARDYNDSTWKPLKDWHKMYREYCLESGDKNPQNSKSLGKIFREKGFVDKHRDSGTWFCIGTLGVDTNDTGEATTGQKDDELPF